MSLRDALQEVYNQRGVLTPRLVVDEARPVDSPLHDRFEWDDSIAGEKYRQEQARELIRSVRIVYKPASGKQAERSVRAWQSIRGESGHTYEPSETVRADPILTQIVLMDMRREWKELRARYEHFAEFAAMIRADLEQAS